MLKKESRFALFCDNLTVQTSDNFKTAVSNLSSIVWFGVSNATDPWQFVDGDFAELLKTLVMQQHSSWLDSDENADKLYNRKILTKEKRILINHWVGAAYKKISSPEYQSFQWRMLEKKSVLSQQMGVPPPYIYSEAYAALPETPTCEPAAESDDLQVL